ncbi:hypothetical protein BH11PLA2_BH11PLA2_48160 [soil metagenome]
MTRRVFLSVAFLALATSFAAAADKAWTFEIYTDKAEDFRFRLKDTDGNVVVMSQSYAKKADAVKMVTNLKEKTADYKFDYTEDKAKKTRFNIVAKNGQVVASSGKGYDTKADAEKVTAAMVKDAKDAKVDDMTEKKK